MISSSASLAAMVAAVLVGASCRGEQWVIGDPALPADAAASEVMSHGCEGAEQVLARRSTWHGISDVRGLHVGRWRGDLSGISARAFPSPDVELTLNADNTGSLEFIGSEPPRPPESAARAYLCDGTVSGGICGSTSGFVGGFSYELAGITARGDVVSFVVIDADPWEPWCELQTSVQRLDPSVSCGHSFGVLPVAVERWSAQGCARVAPDGTEQAIDCGMMYAFERCQCAFDGCFAAFEAGIEVGLNLSDDGQELLGSLWFRSNIDAAPLRLRRAL